MKQFLALLAVVLIAGYAWYYTHQQNEPTAPEPVAAEATPVPEKHLAPPGVYYLTQRISITSDDGITGVSQGTKVNLVKDNGASLLVTDGKTQFEVTQAQVTNDLDIANAAVKKSQAMDAASETLKRNEEAAAIKAQQDELASEAKREQAATPTPPPAASSNPLDLPAYNNASSTSKH